MIERILQFNSILYYYITCLWIKDSLTKQYEIVLSTMRGKIIFKSINSVKKDLNLKQLICFFNNNLSLITLPKYLKQQICFFNINLLL
jgi:hypothetical protein